MSLAIAVAIVIGLSTHTANADVLDVGSIALGAINSALAAIVNQALAATALLVTFAAGLLNVSIVVTLHIRDFVNATPAIYTIWQTIRDMTGLFFIFFLLYAAFQIILNLGNNYGKLVVSIVTAGILINFSFFIVSVLIDASNVVSLAIFNSMVPSSANITYNASTTVSVLASQVTGLNQSSGAGTGAAAGISDVFMNSLKIQSVYDTNGNKLGTAVGDPTKIILIGIVGIIIMITAAASFTLAAIAFIARLIILLFLLAFSPLWFAGMVIPQLKDYMGKFRGHLTDQLIFMPVYLLLMYAALSVLNTSGIMGAASANITNASLSTNWAFSYMVLAINFAMVIFMLNLPLVVGLAMGGEATKFLSKYTKKWSAQNIWKNVGGWTGSQAGSRTLGRVAYSANQSRPMKYLASRLPAIGGLASSGLSKVSTGGFGGGKKGGYEARLAAKKKAEEGMHKRLGEIDRSKFATEAEYQIAKRAAEGYQGKYRENLPWKGTVGGVIGFMVDNRANRQTAFSLSDEADLDQNKEKQKDLDRQIEALKRETRLTATDEEKQKMADLEAQHKEVTSAIKRAGGAKKKKDTATFAKLLADVAIEEGDKEEKPKEKPKEEPKTT